MVRSKETKSVEFDAKVNNIQADGIPFIRHTSFKAFKYFRRGLASQAVQYL